MNDLERFTKKGYLIENPNDDFKKCKKCGTNVAKESWKKHRKNNCEGLKL